MAIDRIDDNKVFIIHDNSIMANKVLAKEQKEIENIIKDELWNNVSLNVEWMSKEEYFKRLMWM